MNDSLIIVCDKTVVVFGQKLYQSSAYAIDDIAKAAHTDHFEIREALLVMGGELEGPHPLNEEVIGSALKAIESRWERYDEDEEQSIEKAAREAVRRKREVFCSFSMCRDVGPRHTDVHLHS